jgi:hypothetical protein
MSRITEKLSKIFTAQIPEFLRVGDSDSIVYITGSTTAGSNIVVLSDSTYVSAGDKLQHSTISGTVYVTNILSNTKIKVDTSLTNTVTNQNLKFTKTDTVSNLVKFLEAYYKFLEQDQQPQELLQNARLYADSEHTIDSLIETFFKNYGDDIPRNIIADKRSFIKHFKDIHKTKGTEEAYKLLFRVMFNTNADFFYPSTVVLKPSDGIWKKDYTLKVALNYGSTPFDFLNAKITGTTSKATAVVNNVLKIVSSGFLVYELYLENIKGTFTEETITATKLTKTSTGVDSKYVTARTYQQVSKIDIIDNGAGYATDTVLPFNGGFARITGVNKEGKINEIKVIDSGAYVTPVASLTGNTLIVPIYIPDPTENITGTITFYNNIGSFASNVTHGLIKNKTANISFPNNSNIAGNTISVLTVLDTKRFVFTYTDANINPAVSTEVTAKLNYISPAVLKANTSPLRQSSGYWLNNKGKISDLIYIQGASRTSSDSTKLFYQPYSYVIKSDVTLDNWKDIVKQTIHPAGTEVFGEILINKEISANLESPIRAEVWDYLGLTADCNVAPFFASTTTYTNSRVANLALTTDQVYVIFNYL